MHAGVFNLPLVGVIELATRLGAAPSIEGAKLNARLTPPAFCGTAAHFAGAGALSGEPMNPIIPIVLSRLAAVAAAGGVVAVPSVNSGAPVVPVPTSLEEGIVQVILAAISLAAYWYQSRKVQPKQ